MAKIGLDYGHGINTFPPSKGVYVNGKAYHEHEFNARLGVKIKRLLESHGHTVVESQPPLGADVSLNARSRLFNRKNVDIVISVHANANSNNHVDGRCAFYWHSSTKGKRLATLIMDKIKDKGYSTHGSGLHASKRGSWTNLHMVRETYAPAVLVENGFMTNNEPGTNDDFELLFGSKKEEYTDDLANAYIEAIQAYFGKPVKNTAPKFVEPDPEDLPTVRSFGKYPRLVKITEDTKAYNYPNLYDYNRTLKKGYEVKVYGETYGSWAGGGGVYFSKKHTKELNQTVVTGGLTRSNVDEMESYIRSNNLKASINFKGEGKNPHARVTIKGKDYEQFCEWLESNDWWFKVE